MIIMVDKNIINNGKAPLTLISNKKSFKKVFTKESTYLFKKVLFGFIIIFSSKLYSSYIALN